MADQFGAFTRVLRACTACPSARLSGTSPPGARDRISLPRKRVALITAPVLSGRTRKSVSVPVCFFSAASRCFPVPSFLPLRGEDEVAALSRVRTCVNRAPRRHRAGSDNLEAGAAADIDARARQSESSLLSCCEAGPGCALSRAFYQTRAGCQPCVKCWRGNVTKH